MNAGQAEGLATEAPEGDGARPEQQCVLLACFAGAKRAGKIRRQLDKRIAEGGDAILDQVVVKVNSKHKAQVHDPRRTLGGTLTPALTWGIFGLLAAGPKQLALWAVIGAICGGLYAYYFEHRLTKDELKRIGGRLPVNSSAIVAFMRGADPQRILSSTASFEPATASVAAVTPDLSAQVYSGGTGPEKGSASARDTALNMLMVRFDGEHAARKALSGSEKHEEKEGWPEVELFIEANEHGRLRVIAPKTGIAAFSEMDILGWGLFGVAYGLIVGFAAGDGGVLGALESGLLVGVLWGIFGAVAGALYGMWAGRGVSARRLKGLGDFVPADTSLVVAWADGSLSEETIKGWAATGSESLSLRFNPAGDGAVLEV
jgi:uncharacterized membrane protein